MESTASAHADGLYLAAFRDRPSARTVDAPYGSMVAHVEVQRALSATGVRLYSIRNENDRYRFVATVRGSRSQVVLVLDRAVITSDGASSAARETTVDFTVDRARAERISRAFGVARLDRSPLGARLEGRFTLERARFAVGEAVRVQFVVRNPEGAPTVQWQVGGRQRGPRDNRFRFRVWRDGALLEERPGLDFGGPTFFTAVAAGASGSMVADVSAWAELSAPGRYRVECSYETTLAPAGVDPFSAEHRHQVWDRRFEGTVEFELTASPDRSRDR